MQEITKFNYVQYGKGSEKGKPKSSGKFHSSANSGGSGNNASTGNPSKSGGKGRMFHCLLTFVGGMVKADTKKDNLIKHWMLCVGTVP